MAKGNSGIAVSDPQATSQVDGQTQDKPVRPTGFTEFARWVVPRLQKDYTIAQMLAEYPDQITKGSFQAKLSKFRKQAAQKGLVIPSTKRASRSQNVDIDALAAELNLSRLTADEPATTSAPETESQS